MSQCVNMFYWSILILTVVGTHGRVTESDLLNVVDTRVADNSKTEERPKIIYLNRTDINDLNALTDALTVIQADPTTRKPCSHHVDVSDNEIRPDDNEPCEPVGRVDNGTALILTPYIKEGRALEGRKASVVDPDIFLGVKSYSGYFTVDEKYDSNMFFWYFPVEGQPVNDTPWIIWLQGGPGASSMAGLFDEIGPIHVNHLGILERNPYTWLQNHSLVFIENPVGTGYSFTNHKEGLVKDMATYSAHLYSTLKQLLTLFPELRTAPLFIAGESYAGKYVPAFGMEIHRNKDTPGGDINLKGLIIGNAYVEPSMLASVPDTFYNFGLLSREQVDLLQPLNEAFKDDIANNRSVSAKHKWTLLVTGILLLSHQKQAYNFLTDDLVIGRYEKFLQRSEVKRALHVGDIQNSFVNISVNSALAPDFLSNTRPMFETLLNHYDVLAYCGQLDQMMACPVAAEHYRRWRWDQSDLYRNATRMPFMYRRRLAGYRQSGGRLTAALVRGAGHMAAGEAPGALQRLVSRWTRALPEPAPGYSAPFVRAFLANATLHQHRQ